MQVARNCVSRFLRNLRTNGFSDFVYTTRIVNEYSFIKPSCEKYGERQTLPRQDRFVSYLEAVSAIVRSTAVEGEFRSSSSGFKGLFTINKLRRNPSMRFAGASRKRSARRPRRADRPARQPGGGLEAASLALFAGATLQLPRSLTSADRSRPGGGRHRRCRPG
jgi:hypothetical protein